MLTKSLRIFVRTCWKALDECSDVACNRCSPYDVPKNLRFLIIFPPACNYISAVNVASTGTLRFF